MSKGLKNLGNTCYLNTTLQCLLHTSTLTSYLRSNKWKSKNIRQSIVITQYKRLLDYMFPTAESATIDNGDVTLNNFVRLVQCISMSGNTGNNTVFIQGRQQDMAEFLQFMIDCFHASLSMPVSMRIEGSVNNTLDKLMVQSLESWKSFFKDEYSIITDMCTGQYITQIMTVDNIGPVEHSEQFDPFAILTLPVPLVQETTINVCLDLFSNPEPLNDWKGSKTNQIRQTEKRMNLWKLPSILIIQFKRFIDITRKNNALIEFPLELDLTEYCLGYDRTNAQYVLYAIGNHTGSLHGGHYYAYCLHPQQQKWYVYNDNMVNEITSSSLVSTAAYCLFYYRKPCSSSSSSSNA